MGSLRAPLFTLICYLLLLLRFCKAYQNWLDALIKTTTVCEHDIQRYSFAQGIQYLRFLVLVLSTFGIGIGIGIESIPGLVNGIDPIVNWY